MPVWPATLPQNPTWPDYSGSDHDALLRGAMDAGPDKVRRRYTAVSQDLSYNLWMNQTQRDTFMAFWRETLQRGAVPFNWVHPEGEGEIICRIKGVPKRSLRGPNLYRISFTIEVLP